MGAPQRRFVRAPRAATLHRSRLAHALGIVVAKTSLTARSTLTVVRGLSREAGLRFADGRGWAPVTSLGIRGGALNEPRRAGGALLNFTQVQVCADSPRTFTAGGFSCEAHLEASGFT